MSEITLVCDRSATGNGKISEFTESGASTGTSTYVIICLLVCLFFPLLVEMPGSMNEKLKKQILHPFFSCFLSFLSILDERSG